MSLVSYVNVLAVRLGFRLIHRLDEVPSVIGLYVTGLLREKGVSHARARVYVCAMIMAMGNKISARTNIEMLERFLLALRAAEGSNRCSTLPDLSDLPIA